MEIHSPLVVSIRQNNRPTQWQCDSFYPRDALLSAVFAVGQCPSVRHTPRIVSKRINHLKTFFTVCPIFHFFLIPCADTYNYIKGRGPSTGGANTRVGKFCDFRPKSPFILETVHGPWLLYGTSIGIRWQIYVSIPMTLSDPTQIFQDHCIVNLIGKKPYLTEWCNVKFCHTPCRKQYGRNGLPPRRRLL